MSTQTQDAVTRDKPSSVRLFSPSGSTPGANSLRLQTLVRLRWLAVAGQTCAVLAVHFGFKFPLPLGWCLAVIALSAGLNIVLTVKYPTNRRLKNQYATLLLSYDVVQLALLLALTGGLENPFSLLFLVPTTASASTLPLRRTLSLGGLTLLCILLVAIYHFPLPWQPGDPLNLPPVYVFGIASALVCGQLFAGIYAWRVAQENRRMSDALGATELVLAREQQLSALDGLAAAAAHELGTPLATIALVAKELRRELPNAGDVKEDLDLLETQAARCREILSTLTTRGGEDDEVLKQLPLSVMIGEIAEIQRASAKPVEIVTSTLPIDGAVEPIIERNPAIFYGIGNLVKNAADFANGKVELEASWTRDTIVVEVRDDGPGFAPEIMNKLGEPYVTTRPLTFDLPHDGEDAQEIQGGMGLGFFIAKTFLERTGASVSATNGAAPDGGAVVRVEWQRGMIEITKDRSTNKPA